MALKTIGFGPQHPVVAKGLQGFQGFAIEEGNTLRVQACISPVWDTCLAMIALQDSGLPGDHPALQRAARWLLGKQIRTGGDWQVKSRQTPPGGWAFEFANALYPDIDDTAEVLIALRRVRLPEQEKLEEGIQQGVAWLLGMQSRNGGWASFDRDNTRSLLARLPFCDFGEVLDPPSADVTAHCLEALGRLGHPSSAPAVQRALKYLLAEQEEDGAWFGRWGVNYIYGTGAALPALEALGLDVAHAMVRRAVEWLAAHQNPDGGWGESCASYAAPHLRGQGPSTASQTAWALLGLMASGEWEHPALERGLRYLVETQREDGSWDEPWFTGAGFPGYGVGARPRSAAEQGSQGVELPAGFMINYHLYRNYWPPMALGRYQRYVARGVKKSTAN
jgi:squalene-hopene/tetraprenyl-beta-curcumene cyclase